MSEGRIRKQRLRQRLENLLDEFSKILVICVDNVGSNMLQQIRMDFRGEAVIMMGKNTMMRKVIREKAEKEPRFAALVDCLVGNVGFMFTNGDLAETRKRVLAFKVPAGARTGAFAPVDVKIPKGATGLDPSNTQFFQALNISTKIARGAIELQNEVHLITAGERISSSAVALLTKLNIKPFFFGIGCLTVYDNGCMYDAKILDLSEQDMLNKFWSGVNMVAALSLSVGYPTLASIPHSFANAFKKLVAVAVETDYSFPEAEIFKAYLADPSAFASAAPAAGGAAESAPEPEPEEDEEEEDMDGFSLFD